MNKPRIAFVGSVNTSRTTLDSLIRNDCDVVGVLELATDASRNVSGFAALADIVQGTEIPCQQFEKVNEPGVLTVVEQWQPDLLFVVGLSQLVGDSLLNLPRIGCVGFHPTKLPKGRGRAPIAWLALGATEPAATFFLMNQGADSGDILVQEPFEIAAMDYARDIEQSIHDAIRRGLDRWLPELNAGQWNPQPQDHSQATYLGKRTPSDGLIDWQRPAVEIARLVRAASHPFPGAFTYFGDEKLIVWAASVVEECNQLGVAGRVLTFVENDQPLVQTGDGVLRLEILERPDNGNAAIRVGTKFGYQANQQIRRLQSKVAQLEEKLESLTSLVEKRLSH